MKKLILSLIVAIFFVTASTHQVQASDEEIYEIYTIEDLYNLRRHSNDDAVLMNNLDFNNPDSYSNPNDLSYGDLNGNEIIEPLIVELTTEKGWEPILIYTASFDGQGYIIDNLYSLRRSSSSLFLNVVGEFTTGATGKVLRYAEIKNVGLKNVEFESYSTSAGIANTMIAGKITSSFVDGKLSSHGGITAGIVGQMSNRSIIEDSYTTGFFNGKGKFSQVSGIAAVVYGESKVANTYTTARLIGSQNVAGILAKQLYGFNFVSGNNIVFSDYISGSATVFRSVGKVFAKETSLYSRYDTRIQNVDSGFSVIAQFEPGTIDLEEDLYDVDLANIYNKFEGLYMDYDDFKTEEFFTSPTNHKIIIRDHEYTAGFTQKCAYQGVKTCEELDEQQQDFFVIKLWDFENTWEIKDGSERPTLKVFSGNENNDEGLINTAPITGGKPDINGTVFTGGMTLNMSWPTAHLVVQKNRDGLLYDIYYSVGITEDKDEWVLLAENYTTQVVDGYSKFNFEVPYDLDSSSIRFYVIAHNGEEYAEPVSTNVVAIDNEFPTVVANTANDLTIENDNFTNQDFVLQVEDSTRVSAYLILDGNDLGKQPISKVYTEAGVYEFTVLDELGNSKAFKITLVNAIPELAVTADGVELGNKTLTQSDIVVTASEDFLLEYTFNNKVLQWESGDTFTKDGLYEFLVQDEYGNANLIEITIDKNAPSAFIEINDEHTEFTASFNELVAQYSLDGETWISLNDTSLTSTLESDSLYIQDTAGSIRLYDMSVQEESSLGVVIAIAGSITAVLGGAVAGFIFIRKGRI